VDADINAWSCLANSPVRQELTKERLQLVAALVEMDADKHLQVGVNIEDNEEEKRNWSIKAWLEAKMNQSKCAVVLGKVVTNSTDLLKKPELFLLLLKHFYKVKVTAAMKIADLKGRCYSPKSIPTLMWQQPQVLGMRWRVLASHQWMLSIFPLKMMRVMKTSAVVSL
jgi:hypothetical protein